MIPHNHDWESISKTYAAPTKILPTRDISDSLMEKCLLGLTTLVSRCRICQQLQKEEILGTDELQLDDLMDKVESFGPQYIYRGENTFMIGAVPKEPDPVYIR